MANASAVLERPDSLLLLRLVAVNGSVGSAMYFVCDTVMLCWGRAKKLPNF